MRRLNILFLYQLITMQTITKYIKRILIGTVLGVFFLYSALYVLLSFPYIQNQAREIAIRELTALTGTPLSIASIQLRPFNNVSLQGVFIPDLNQDTLLYANKLSAGFELLPLFRKELKFTTIQLIGFDINITREDKESAPNFKFFIDAFASKDTLKQKTPFSLQLGTVMLRRGNISYDVFSAPRNPEKFDANHIRVKDLLANISLRTYSQDSVNLYLKRLSFEEQAGLKVNKLTLHLAANKKAGLVHDLSLTLPQSRIAVDTLSVNYANVTRKEEFADSADFQLLMKNSEVSLRDIHSFAPVLQHFKSKVNLRMKAHGTINNLQVPNISVSYGDDLGLEANASLLGITTPKEAYLFGQVARLNITPEGISGIANNFSSDKKDLPGILNRLGEIHFNGDISGFFSNLVAYGKIHTRLGVLNADMLLGNDLTNKLLTYKGSIKTSNFKINELLPGSNPLGKISFALNVDGRQQKGFKTRGTVKGKITSFDFKGYRYDDLSLDGSYLGKSFDGSAFLNDENGKMKINGKINISPEGSTFNFLAKGEELHLDRLNLLPKYKGSSLSFTLKANFEGNRFDNANGEIRVDSLSFENKEQTFLLDSLCLTADNRSVPQAIYIHSDLISGQLTGSYSFATLIREWRTTAGNVLPVLTPKKGNKSVSRNGGNRTGINNFDFALQLADTKILSEVLELPVTLNRPAVIGGSYNTFTDNFHLNGEIPSVSIGKMELLDGSLSASIPQDRILLRYSTHKLTKNKEPLFLSLNTEAHQGVITTRFDWSNIAQTTYSGNFSFKTKFTERKGKYPLLTEINVLPSSLIFNDSIWDVNPSSAAIDSGRIKINDFKISHQKQLLRLNGVLSKLPSDSLHLNLRDMNLDYIFQTLNINYVQFGGQGTGDFLLTHKEKNPVVKTENFHVKDFSYNDAHLGDIALYSDWDNLNKGIYLKGIITQPDAAPSIAEGSIFIGNDSLWLNFDANKLNVDFVHVWTDNIIQNFGGRASGNLTLFGKFKTLSIVGDAYADNAHFDVGYLNTTYYVSDSVKFREDGIFFNQVSLFDKFGNKAAVNGRVNYHYFKDIKYDISMLIPENQSFQVLNLTEKLSPVYWGAIYASGSARIYGDVKKTWIDVSARTKPNSKFYFSLNDNMTAGDYKFITFRDTRKEAEAKQKEKANASLKSEEVPTIESPHDLNLNLQVDATPDGTINLIMDPASGDIIKGTGSGNIRLEYNKTTDFRLFGSYVIDKGSYYFNLQDVITRDFTINQGSTVTFRGEPLNAELDIQAYYQVTANLADLDESFADSRELSRTNVPVQCVLNIDGDLRRPDLSFDINLPTVSQDIDRQVKSIISTDDMMNRQILYLMILNKFYTPDYVNTGEQKRYNELASVASSTLSSQLNNLLGQLSDNWNIGTNIRSDKGDFSDVEVELALSSQLLNNRLLLNGNFGYRDNPNANNSFIGDFDLEYLLNKAGSLRLKAYNHYNDRNYSVKSALTTQGVGIIVKKDFDNFPELYMIFRRNKMAPVPKK